MMRGMLGFILCPLVQSAWTQCTVVVQPVTNGCAGEVVDLVPEMNGGVGPWSFQWSPATGLSSDTVMSPQLTVQPGNVLYTLVVTDAMGCTATAGVMVSGEQVVQAQFTHDAGSTVCAGQMVTFSDQSGMPVGLGNDAPKRVWQIAPDTGWTLQAGALGQMNGSPDDPLAWTCGTSGLVVVFEEPGPYVVTLVMAGACGQSEAMEQLSVSALPPVPIVATNSPLCAGQTLSLSAVSTGNSAFLWTSPTGGTFLQASVNVPDAGQGHAGTWAVNALANGCAGQPALVEVVVTPPPTVAVSPGFTTFCAGGEVTLVATGAQSFSWYVGGGNVGSGSELTVQPASTTTYTVTGGNNGCTGFASATVLVHPLPQVDYVAGPDACVGQPHAFSSEVQGAAAITWSFGDGTFAFEADPVHVYAVPGVHAVTLEATSPAGCTASVIGQVVVWDMPQAAFSADVLEGCVPLPVTFSDLSIGNVLQHAWDLGEGTTSDVASPQHVYTTGGPQAVSLAVTNGGGCTSTATQLIDVFPIPVAGFDMPGYPSCQVPVQLQLVNTSIGATGHSWDLGNGQQSVAQSPSVTYDQPGAYTVQLVVINDHGCSDTLSGIFEVTPAQVAAFDVEPAMVCAGGAVLLSSTSMNAGQWHWMLSDGATYASPVVEYVPSQAGTLDVTLVVAGNDGCADTLFLPAAVTVLSAPEAAFDVVPSATVANAFRFIDRSTGAEERLWDFGIGTDATATDTLVLYPADGGTWNTCLRVVNGEGCTDEICLPIEVVPAQQVFAPTAFTPDGDGINDLFVPVLDGFIDRAFTFSVFDRWGRQVHAGRDRLQGWDGTQGGSAVPEGVYVWRIELEGPGPDQVFTGHVTLIR